MDRRRILLVDMPQMLRDIVRSLVSGEPDLVLVAELPDPDGLEHAVSRHRPDVVIGHSTRRDIERLLGQWPTMKVLQVEANGRSSFLYELRPQRIALGEISSSRLLEAIRA